MLDLSGGSAASSGTWEEVPKGQRLGILLSVSWWFLGGFCPEDQESKQNRAVSWMIWGPSNFLFMGPWLDL